jgi:2-polyprenyl-3-methyl-5-hydroxy-6-metoxy-1,4-benzoquinol methylase
VNVDHLAHQLAHQLAQKWAEQLGRWGIPEHILENAPESPWTHDPKAFAVDDALPTDTPSYTAAKQALNHGGTVIDVGVGGGRSSLGLGALATHITGVDASQAMLDRFSAAATEQNTPHTTIRGNWPDVAEQAGTADIVICHHVLYNVAAIIPFIGALTMTAKRKVIVEITESHPQSRLNNAWLHFHNITRPTRPTATDAIDLISALNNDVETASTQRTLSVAAIDKQAQVAYVRRTLCLPIPRESEVAAYLAEHPLPETRTAVTITWSGSANSK